MKKKFLITPVIIFFVILLYGCENEQSKREMTNIQPSREDKIWLSMLESQIDCHNDTLLKTRMIPSIEDARKSQSFELEMALRWKNLLVNINKIRVGQSKDKVISILGLPDEGKFIPKNVMQYSVLHCIRPKGEDGKYVIIEIEDDKVSKILRTNYIFGPQLHQNKEPTR